MTGAEMIAAERQRQIDAEGWTPDHDDEHEGMEMTSAACCYAKAALHPERYAGRTPTRWPWEWDWWKPSADPTRNLVKAGALLAAEIDRLQRQEAK